MELQRVIFGIDISTSRIGISAVTTDEKLVFADTIAFKKKDLSLEDKAHIFENTLGKIMQLQRLHPLAVFVEEPFTAFAGGKQLPTQWRNFNGSTECAAMLFTKASSIFQPSCSQHEPVALSTRSRFPEDPIQRN